MRKSLCLIGIAAATSLFSCSKNSQENPAPKPSITITSQLEGKTFTPGQHIVITWKTQNLPANSVISSSLYVYPGGGSVGSADLKAVHAVAGAGPNIATNNDGSEEFIIPSDNDLIYHFAEPTVSYGQKFTISLFVEYEKDGLWKNADISTESKLFAIYPNPKH